MANFKSIKDLEGTEIWLNEDTIIAVRITGETATISTGANVYRVDAKTAKEIVGIVEKKKKK